MKYVATVFVVVFIASRAFCGEGLPILGYGTWTALTNTANFHEIHSTTNIPPKVIAYILSLPLGVQARDRQRMAEPGEPLVAGYRLVWAATDSTNYVVHYEFATMAPRISVFRRQFLTRRMEIWNVAMEDICVV